MFWSACMMVGSRRRRLGPSLLLLAVAAVLVQENEAFFRRSSFVRLRSGAAQDVAAPLDGTDTDCVPEAASAETMSHEEEAKAAPSKPGWSPGAFFMRLRSGAVQTAEEDSDDETVTNSTDTLSDEEGTEQVPTKPVWSPGALFDLKNQIIADITEEDEIAVAKADGTRKEVDDELDDDEEEEGDSGLSEEEDETDEEEEEEEEEDTEEEQDDAADSSGGGQRGGAMVKEAKARRFQWLAPLETEKVAPSSSRIISDEETDFDEDEEERDEGIEVQITSDNVYEVEFAADDSEQKDIVEEVALSVEPEESESEQPGVVESESTGTEERLEDLSAVNGTTEQKLVSPEDSEKISTDAIPAVALDKDTETDETTTPEMALSVYDPHSPYESSGLWSAVDDLLSFGLARQYSSLKVSRRLRRVRKLTAKYTGLHGFLSGKRRGEPSLVEEPLENEQMGAIQRRLEAIQRAKERIPDEVPMRSMFGRRTPRVESDYGFAMRRSAKEEAEEKRRMERVKEIDQLFIEGQERLFDLVCEKDMLQRRPNPLWEYTTKKGVIKPDDNTTLAESASTTRTFNFPPQDLVDEYLNVLFLSSRLVKMNHTDLWKNSDYYNDEDELLDDYTEKNRWKKAPNGNTNGNWWLRNGLGEKIGEAAETAAYKSVCNSLMSVLARSLSSIHGLNVMTYSDIRLSMEQAPELPPVSAGMIPGSGRDSDYAKKALQDVMQRGARKNRKKRRRSTKDREFLQRAAIVETLLSHCQISAPLLQLFPLAWQRALLSNIITLTTTVIGDFCEGIEFHILGHRLSFAFTPITEEDMLRGLMAGTVSQRQPPQEEFEAAVRATADELSQELKFLDRWHERALGSGMLRSQIANLIARIVLTIVNDLLRGARMDLWTKQAGGPRLVAGLEYRTGPGG